MTRDELVAALKVRKVSDWRRDETARWLARRIKADLTPSGLREGGEACVDALCDAVAAQAADAERLAEALDAALRTFDATAQESPEWLVTDRAYAAFLQSLTGTTTR